jgi:transcriptional regulator with XRE-family HTH domain
MASSDVSGTKVNSRRTPHQTTTRGSELALFLRSLRNRIDPAAPTLGSFRRLLSCVGKRVTQAEVAEAIGVSREWYAVLESARQVRSSSRPSPALLGRIADALMLTRDERQMLFQLTVPEEWRAQLKPDSLDVLDAFSRLRLHSKRLLTATTVEDILASVHEQIADWFDRPLYIHTARRRDWGMWETQPVDDKQERSAFAQLVREAERILCAAPDLWDAANLYPQLPDAGDVGTDELQPPTVKREVARVCTEWNLAGYAFLKARVRSRTGIISSISIFHEVGHSYSALDRAVLGAMAETVSLALS